MENCVGCQRQSQTISTQNGEDAKCKLATKIYGSITESLDILRLLQLQTSHCLREPASSAVPISKTPKNADAKAGPLRRTGEQFFSSALNCDREQAGAIKTGAGKVQIKKLLG